MHGHSVNKDNSCSFSLIYQSFIHVSSARSENECRHLSHCGKFIDTSDVWWKKVTNSTCQRHGRKVNKETRCFFSEYDHSFGHA